MESDFPDVRLGRPDGPVDPILASPWARHDGIEERVQWWLEFWQTRARAPFQRYLTRMGRYEDFIDTELAARQMPPSLRYLPIIEAGYYPTALSPVGAGGLWQFMPPTARWLGLEVTTIVDQRMDPYAATPTALGYLQSLYEQFGSWFLALAAYNSGPGRIERIVRQHGDGAPRDDALFWKIRDHLPSETRDFIPKYLAAVRVASDPASFGFTGFEPDPPQVFDEAVVDGAASLDVVAEVAGTTEEDVRFLNPHLVRGLTPAGTRTVIRLPAGLGEGFQERLASVPPGERVTFTEHRVASGETLSHIAANYRVAVGDIQAANPTVEARRLQIGTRLVIPRSGAGDAGAGGGSLVRVAATEPSPPPESARVPGRVHVVSRGESLWLIARLYRVDVDQIRGWNGLGSSDDIYPGDELRVKEPGSTTYRVQAGDTLWDIARAHRISTDELLEYNGLSNGLIRPGDELQIPPLPESAN